MIKERIFLLALAALGALGAAEVTTSAKTTELTASEKTTQVTTTTTTVITETVIKEKAKWSPFRICVLDFSSLDIQGQKRFLDEKNKPIDIPPQCTLNDADRKSINSVMQGFVRMIDAWDNTQTNAANRMEQIDDNSFDRTKAINLYNKIVNGETRPMVIGAEYLTAYLGRHNDVFSCLDPSLMAVAMRKLESAPDFPKDFMLKLARETGATHLIYGTVSDMRSKNNSFKGYGIETKSTNYELDVIVKLVDLAAQHTVYSNVYTGTYREQQPISGTQFDNNIFQNLMTAALEQAAEDLYDKCRPGRKNTITVTPIPYTLTVQPTGDMLFKAEQAEVFVDGIRAGYAGTAFLVPSGMHVIEVKAPGYKTNKFDINVTQDATINTKLEK